MPDLTVELSIPRPVTEVRAWWLDFPADYRATDTREQPWRIVTLSRTAETIELMTYWRMPLGVRSKVPETFHIRADGWTVYLKLPMGLKQRDEFEVVPDGRGGTRVRIEVDVEARGLWRKLPGAIYRAYARKYYPLLWQEAARLCARDAPRLDPNIVS